MKTVIQCEKLSYSYGHNKVIDNLSFSVGRGEIFGLLGKNGAGKTTIINLLNGYLQPQQGNCRILGQNCFTVTPEIKAKIGFLMENHIQYGFMTITNIEKFYSSFYDSWNKELFYQLIDKMGAPHSAKISTLSCGQRSQVALGLIMAQDPEVLILDDYSMGLDPGYRKLFIDYLNSFVQRNNKTVFITSHIIQDMEQLINSCLILGKKNVLYEGSVKHLLQNYRKYGFKTTMDSLPADEFKYEIIGDRATVYTYMSPQEIKAYLTKNNIPASDFKEETMSLEEAFISLTGKY